MPHFMVRRQANGPQHFQNVPQTGKRFFYHLDNQGFPVDDNTVINYEANLTLSHAEFQQLIQAITGNQNPTVVANGYGYHLDKNTGFIDVNYCTNTLGLPNNINGYNLAKIGIAADYANYQAKGNILFIFCDQNNQDNEVCISIHIKYSNQATNFLNQLTPLLNVAVNSLQPQNNPFWQLNPSDDFNALGYVVTSGQQQEVAYKNAHNHYTVYLFNQLPNL